MTRYMTGPRWLRFAGAAFALLALIAVFAVALGDARGAEKIRTITVEGDFELGVRLLRDGGRIRYVEPYLDTGPSRDLVVGQDGAVRSRMYFVKGRISFHEIRDRIEARDWQGLLGYVPSGADTTPGYIVGDPRWAPLVNKCPALFPFTGRAAQKKGLAPERMRLLKADIDNDGVTDTVLHSFYPRWPDSPSVESQKFEKIDFERCSKTKVFYSQGKLAIFTHDGEQFMERYPRLPSQAFVIILKSTPGVYDLNVNHDYIVQFSGIHRLSDYAANPQSYRIIQRHRK